ncbi:multidrug effflux MFS transporter [Xenorhabdus sp. Reich]|uniref:Multidrug effflux MFS transporter n=1 Tax=Xenorhabdus littoralis TaxID=2582835 RepID=A0ABU4SMW9_9GAMM|nr:MFS transporter [Xenorhabdus sp. Reich]MDX7999998.1 multidrug effflux MFS transporter [Xenorhabdus sp. Reich]
MQQLPNEKINSMLVGVIIVLLVSMGQFNNTLFIPSLPHMSVPLGTSDSFLQFSVTLTLLAFGFSQLIYGPLSDYYGRRPVVLIGLIIFFLGNVFCLFATSGVVFLIGKIITGLGVGCVGPIARAVARDLSDGKALLKLMGMLVMFMSITPAISPMLGGAIQGYLGWRMNFIILSVVAFFFIVFIYYSLPETNEHRGSESNIFNFSKVFVNYRDLLLHGEFLRMALFNMFGFAAELVFLLSSSYILQEHFNLPPQQFGLIPLAIVPCVMIGNFIVTKLSSYLEVNVICTIGILLILVGSLLMFLFSQFMPSAIYSFIVPMMIVALGEGIVTPSSTARCMDLYGKKAGYAGAAVGAIAMVGAGVVIGISLINPLHSLFNISVALLVISFILLALCLANWICQKREIT